MVESPSDLIPMPEKVTSGIVRHPAVNRQLNNLPRSYSHLAPLRFDFGRRIIGYATG
jgi:hypothetical protein